MKKVLFACITIIASGYCLPAQSSQTIGVWLDHLPYGRGVDVEVVGKKVYCAVEQGLFIYDRENETIERLSKVNGLSDVDVSTIAWSDEYQTLLIGYQNGNIDLYTQGDIVNVPDIKISGNYSGLKSINRIITRDKMAYICTDFGIVTYDLEKRFVKETFVIGSGGATLKINDVVLTPDSIYAATPDGLMKASRSQQLIFFANWSLEGFFSGEINHVELFNNELIVNKVGSNNDDRIWRKTASGWDLIEEIDPVRNEDLRATNGSLVVTNSFSVRGYTADFSIGAGQNLQANSLEPGRDFFFKAGVIDANHNTYGIENEKGLYFATIYDNAGNTYNSNKYPNSPRSKDVFTMFNSDGVLYVAPGAVTSVWAPSYNNAGFFVLKNFVWENYSNTGFHNYQDIVALVTDPNDPGHFYAAAYGTGILEFRNGVFQQLINAASTSNAFPAFDGNGGHRIGGFSANAETGDIWFTNSLTEKPLGVIRADGTIESFSVGAALSSNEDVKTILYTTQNQVWMQTRNDGVVVVNINENGEPAGQAVRLSSTEGSGALPSESVLSFAEDLDGEIWLGSNEGMAVLYSPQNIFEAEANFDFQNILLDEDGDGYGDPVLGGEVINDIEVDGSNKKWFATANSGVFYTSENGKEQIYHFTRDNSPLPSDNVIDIEIDDISGMVYFGTDQGIVSFQGAATKGANSHTDVFAYPNPVKPGYTGPILIRGLVTNAQVKIADMEGNIVYETIAEGGQALWNGNNLDGRRARSGVYLAYITNDDGSLTAVTKIMIIN